MPRRLLISLLALGVLLVGAPASAQPPPVTTTTQAITSNSDSLETNCCSATC